MLMFSKALGWNHVYNHIQCIALQGALTCCWRVVLILFFFSLQFACQGAMLTHSCSLGYNGAVLQAIAVHLSLQGALDLPQQFIGKLITEMEEVEDNEAARNDARMWVLRKQSFLYSCCSTLH